MAEPLDDKKMAQLMELAPHVIGKATIKPEFQAVIDEAIGSADMNDKMFRLDPKITPLFGRRIPRTFWQWCWWSLRGRPEGEEDYGPSLMSTDSIAKMKWYDEPVEPETDMEKREGVIDLSAVPPELLAKALKAACDKSDVFEYGGIIGENTPNVTEEIKAELDRVMREHPPVLLEGTVIE